ncbi:putative ribonuclease H-like domain-containing protein [Tanacetum coccineum]
MAPKRTATTTTTSVTDAQLKELIARGVADALEEIKANTTSRNGDDSHDSGTCSRRTEMFPEESDVIEKYVGGLPDMIHKSVMTSKPKTMQDAIEFVTEPMDKKINTLAERQAENKRKLDNNNQAQQQTPKKQCKFHHNGQCTIKCANCKRVGHLTRDCRSPAATNNQRNLTCYECGNQGHYRSDCLELKNQNHGNQAGGTGAHRIMYALGGGETNQDLNNMDNDINA